VFLTLRRERLPNLPFSTNLLNDQKDHVTSQDLHEFCQVLKDQKRRQEENPIVDPEEWPEAVDLVFVTELAPRSPHKRRRCSEGRRSGAGTEGHRLEEGS